MRRGYSIVWGGALLDTSRKMVNRVIVFFALSLPFNEPLFAISPSPTPLIPSFA